MAMEGSPSPNPETARRGREYLQFVADAAATALAHCDASWRFVFVNKAYAVRLGLTPDQIIGRTVAEILGEKTAEAIAPYVDRALSGESLQYEIGVTYPTVGWRYLHCAYTPETDAQGRVTGWVAAITDITERHRLEQALRESEARLRLALEDSPIVLFQHDRDLRYTWIYNPTFDLPAERILGRTDREVFPDPEDAGPVMAAKGRVVETGQPARVRDLLIHAPDGRETWWDMTILPLRDDTGAVAGIRCLAVDVTDRKVADRLLDRYRLLSQHAKDIVLFIRADGRIAEANDAAVAAYGYDHDSLLGMTIFDLRDPETAGLILEQMIQADGHGITFETVHRRRDGSAFPVEVSSRGAEVGGERLLLSIVRDVSERKRAEEELREADRRKDEFLATLAHELRNPLAPIRNAVEILRLKSPEDPHLEWARDVIGRQAQQLTRLVDDLLDVSRITRGRIELRRERTDLSAVLERALETSRPVIEAARHRLTVGFAGEPLPLLADPTRMAQILSNLLNNAAKYTRTGGHIRLSARRSGDQAVLQVEDDGIGIPREMLSRIFEMFSQVDTSLERAQGGLGIGLTIAKRLAEMHGGTLDAESGGPGAGSVFTLRLPLALEPAAAADPEAGGDRPPPPALRILVVDDNQDSAESLAMLLRLRGHDVRTAHDGPTGLEAAGDHRAEVVFLDIGMPGMNGYDVARRLRERPDTRDVRLVAMTGWGQEEDRRRAREAGFDRHLVKPLDLGSLDELLTGLASRPI